MGLFFSFFEGRRVRDSTGKETLHSKFLIKAHVHLPLLGLDKPGSDQKQQGAHPRGLWQEASVPDPSEEYG